MNGQSRPLNLKNRITTDNTDANVPLRVNFENVVKQGILNMKGKILRLFNTECMFYLEKSRKITVEGATNEFQMPDGPYLKYGAKKKSVQFSLDLTPYNPKLPLSILNVEGS